MHSVSNARTSGALAASATLLFPLPQGSLELGTCGLMEGRRRRTPIPWITGSAQQRTFLDSDFVLFVYFLFSAYKLFLLRRSILNLVRGHDNIVQEKKEGKERKERLGGRKWGRRGREWVCIGRLHWHLLSRNALPGVSLYNLFLFFKQKVLRVKCVFSTNFAKKQSSHKTPTLMEEW